MSDRCHDARMDDPTKAGARLALSLAEAVARDERAANAFLVEAFDSLEDAALAHAHLNGFLLVALAAARRESVADAVSHVRELLNSP